MAGTRATGKSTGKSRVTRAGTSAKPKTDPGPVKSKADLAENTAPRRGAGPTRVGANTPVPGGRNSRVSEASPRTRDMSQRTTGQSIVQRANAVADRKARGGK